MPVRYRDFESVPRPMEPALSPDGSRVVYVLCAVDASGDTESHGLWLMEVETGKAFPLRGGDAGRSPAWSPDGSRIAFLRSEEEGAPQLWIGDPADLDSAVKITDRELGAGKPVWDPVGSRIAFVALHDPAPEPEHAPVATRRLRYKLDGMGLVRGVRAAAFVVDIDSGIAETVASVPGDVGPSIAWHPDGGTLLAPGPGGPDSDLSGRRPVWRIPLEGGEAIPTACPEGYTLLCAWVDGESFIVVGRDDVSVGHERLLLYCADGSLRADLTADLDRSVALGGAAYPGGEPRVLDDGRVLFCARDEGTARLFVVDPAYPQPPRMIAGDAQTGFSQPAASAGRIAAVRATPDCAAEVVVLNEKGAVLAETSHAVPGATVAGRTNPRPIRPVARNFTLPRGGVAPGWILRDPRATGPTPLLVDIHGGPHSAWSPLLDRARTYQQLLAARGWTVLLINPPASDGYGEEYFTGNLGTWGFGDEDYFLAPVEALVAEGLADPDRLALSGYSYGGFAACWLTARTTRFAAAIAGGVITSLEMLPGSDYGVPDLALEVRGAPWDDLSCLDAQSPIRRIGNVRTPTLIYQGGADDRCPPLHAEAWFAGLRAQGVPVELVLYPGAAHEFIASGALAHRRDLNDRMLAWLDEHVIRRPA